MFVIMRFQKNTNRITNHLKPIFHSEQNKKQKIQKKSYTKLPIINLLNNYLPNKTSSPNLLMSTDKNQSIHEDTFLKSKDIEIERSSFLANHYSTKAFHLRNSFNPKDEHGSRLSQFWLPGDTIWSVSWKKFKRNFILVFNPDTYSKQSLVSLKQIVSKHKVDIISMGLVIGIPYLVIYPILRPRLLKVRRQFLFQYYKQTQILSKKLGAKSRLVPVHEIQKNIAKEQTKIRL